ncbi:MAG: TRAP transporter large permease [Candidatus Hodarchaeota archaeon]
MDTILGLSPLAFIGIMMLFFLVMAMAGVGIAIALGITVLGILVIVEDIPSMVVVQRIVAGCESFTLSAVPFFILAGELMNVGGITKRLVDFSKSLVGFITGGLGHVVVVVNMIMAGVSGSATADAAATGTILIPALKKAGYPAPFSASLVSAACTIGPLIPPSIVFVILGSIAEISIGRLFLGGAIPGFVVGIALMIAVYIRAKRQKYVEKESFELKRLIKSTKDSILALLMPVVVIGGMVFGIFTPTEAGVIGTVYGLILGVFIYRELDLQGLKTVFQRAILLNARIMFIFGFASLLGWIFARESIPDLLMSLIMPIASKPWSVMILLNSILFILGCVMEATSILIILGPLMLQLAGHFGIDPIHFGVVMCFNLLIALMTPPVGMAMFVTTSIGDVSIPDFTRAVIPFLITMLLVLSLLIFIPQLVLYLPNTLMRGF